jgi:hypothetical protein
MQGTRSRRRKWTKGWTVCSSSSLFVEVASLSSSACTYTLLPLAPLTSASAATKLQQVQQQQQSCNSSFTSPNSRYCAPTNHSHTLHTHTHTNTHTHTQNTHTHTHTHKHTHTHTHTALLSLLSLLCLNVKQPLSKASYTTSLRPHTLLLKGLIHW